MCKNGLRDTILTVRLYRKVQSDYFNSLDLWSNINSIIITGQTNLNRKKDIGW